MLIRCLIEYQVWILGARSLGVEKSNIIVYADDIVLIVPSKKSLQLLVNEAFLEASKIDLTFNFQKSESVIYYSHYKKDKLNIKSLIHVNNDCIENTDSMKYLGYILSSNLKDTDDMIRVRNKAMSISMWFLGRFICWWGSKDVLFQ